MAMEIPPLVAKTSGPTRSRTHPLRTSKKTEKRVKHGVPLDPEDLYRRLERHKEAQERARERRRNRAEKIEGKHGGKNGNQHVDKPGDKHGKEHETPKEYRHIPQTAAADFVKTATQDLPDKQYIHPLSQAIVGPYKLSRPRRRLTDMGDSENRDVEPGTILLPLRNALQYPSDRHDWAQRDETIKLEARGLKHHVLPMLLKSQLLNVKASEKQDGSVLDQSTQPKSLSKRRSSFLPFGNDKK